MSLPCRHTALNLALAAALPLLAASPAAQAQSPAGDEALPPIVITAPATPNPLVTQFNPRAPQQPLPANDGASLLKTIPGMNVIRKGGTDGDPVFRGMAASRLNILIDGEQLLGGCGMRMDPPTAYVFPDAFDKVSLIKGPQTVVQGPGGSAGTVLFERKPTYFKQPGAAFQAALTGASFGRHEAYADAKAGTPLGYVQAVATQAASGDYRDGNGERVHSAYRRSSLTTALGWTPDEQTRLELSAIESRAQAAYGDRRMDGSRFDRSNLGLKFDKSRMNGLVNRVEAQLYENDVDHVMDNYSLRPLTGGSMAMASNPDRRTRGGRLAVTLKPDDVHKLVLGLDHQRNVHALRKSGAGGDLASPYLNQPRVEDARFRNTGLFGELTHEFNEQQRLVAGWRQDHWVARDRRATVAITPLSGMMSLNVANPTAGQERDERLHSGFVRFEHDVDERTQAYIGLGHTQRAPDYWELISKESATTVSAFDKVRPEKTTQLDLGLTHEAGAWQSFGSVWLSQIQDYILVQTNVSAGSGMTAHSATIARNVDARTWGGELGTRYAISSAWTAQASLSHVHGQNRTDERALGQMPPLEARLGLDWRRQGWAAGALWRVVAGQHRYALNEGNIVGQDLGATGGFGVLSLNGSYGWGPQFRLSLGVDNLLDKTYAESISRGGSALMGYDQTTRVNEPGRTWWIKAQLALN